MDVCLRAQFYWNCENSLKRRFSLWFNATNLTSFSAQFIDSPILLYQSNPNHFDERLWKHRIFELCFFDFRIWCEWMKCRSKSMGCELFVLCLSFDNFENTRQLNSSQIVSHHRFAGFHETLFVHSHFDCNVYSISSNPEHFKNTGACSASFESQYNFIYM